MTVIISIFLVILGASVGSFLSVVIYRLEHKQKGAILGRSRCPHCKKTLGTYDLIPILNYILLRGKCRYCGEPISLNYFFLELSTALVFLLMFFRFPFIIEPGTNALYTVDWTAFLQFLFYTIDGTLLIAVFFYDLQYVKIPDVFMFPLIFLCLLGSLILNSADFPSLLIALLIALVFFGSQFWLSKGEWLGEGDLYLGIAMAFLFGWKLFLVSVSLTYILGAVISAILLAARKLKAKSKIPFAPFMVFGAFATILYGQEILQWYIKIVTP